MKQMGSLSTALFVAALSVVGALAALLAVVTLRDLGWDVSGSDSLVKLGIALGLLLSFWLLFEAGVRLYGLLRVRRVRFLRVMNARIRGAVFDDAVYTDFRDLPRLRRREVRREMRDGGRV